MSPKGNGGGSGRKRTSRRSQKSTSKADGSSNSKASKTQSNQPPNSGAVTSGRKDDASPSTYSSRSNAVKNSRSRSSRRNQSTEKSKNNQSDLHNESPDSFPSDDQIAGGGQQQAYPPVSKSRAKNEPKTIKKENQDPEVPTQGGGPRRSRKNATAGSNATNKLNSNNDIKEVSGSQMPLKRATHGPPMTIKFNPNKAIKKEEDDFGPPFQRGWQTSGKKATNEPNMTVKYDSYKAINAEQQGSGLFLQTSGKNATYGSKFIKIYPNKAIKKERKSPEPPNQKGFQMPRNEALGKQPNTKSNTSMFDLDNDVLNEVPSAKLPAQRGSQYSRIKAPVINQEVKNSEPSNQRGLQVPRKQTPGKEATTKSNTSMFDLDNYVMNEVPSAKLPAQRGSQYSRIKTPVIIQEVKYSEPSNQRGLQDHRKKAPGNKATTKSNTSMFDLDVIMGKETKAKLPIQRGSQNPRNLAPVPNLYIKIEPKTDIKRGGKSPEPPNQKGFQMPTNKAFVKVPTTKSNISMFDLDDVVIEEEANTKLPPQRNHRGPRNHAKDSNPRIRYDPNKIIKSEDGYAHWGSQGYRKAAPQSNSWVKCNENQMAKNEVKHTELTVQRGPQSSMTKAPSKDTNPRTMPHAAPPITKMVPNRTELHPNRMTEMEIPPFQLASSQGIRKQGPASDMWSSLGINDTDDEGKDSELPIQWGTDNSNQRLKKDSTANDAATDYDCYANFDPNQIIDDNFFTQLNPPNMVIKQEVCHPEYAIPINQNVVQQPMEPPQCLDNQFNPNQIIKEEPPEPPSYHYPTQMNPNTATAFDGNQIIEEEVQEPPLHYYPNQRKPNNAIPIDLCQKESPTHNFSSQFNPNNAIAFNPNQVIKEEPQVLNSCGQPTQYDPNKIIKKEKRASDLPLWSVPPAKITHNSDSLNCPQPQSSNDDPWANFFSEIGIVDTNCNTQFFVDGSTAGNSAEFYDTPVQSHQSSDFPPSAGMASQWQTGSNGSGFIDPSMANHNYLTSSQSNHYCGLAFDVAGNPDDSSAEAAIDARLEAELASWYSDGGQVPEPEPEKSEAAKKMEAEIDARLQAELESLPFVEAPVEAAEDDDDFVDNLLSSFLNPNPQTSNAVVVSPISPPTACTASASSANKVANLQRQSQQRPLSQVPMVAQVTGLQGQVVSLTYTTAPDGLVTSVSTTAAETPLAQANEMHSLTAAQLHQILQSGQPYLALPMIVPGGQEEVELGYKDASGMIAPTGQAVEDEEVDYEEIGVADTFAEYWPSKLKFGRAHPDPVVETATLSSVELPDITYELALTPRTNSCLSALQLEAVVYACQAHEQILPSGERAGFLLGDGAGVGKGRTIAGIIVDNFMNGRKRALWVSVSNDLKFDAERDLHDIRADDRISVVPINKFKYSRIDSEDNENFKKGVIFCTYTALIGESVTANSKYKTRLRQLVCWLGKKFDGVIVFDECHKAKNLSMMNVGKSTKTGTTVLELQKLLPDARVVYASATGASEPRNMAYMVRLGLWGPGTAYPEFHEFVNAVEKRGIGAMEIVAMDMKLRGTYISRQLSFKEVTFRIEEVIISKEYRKTYNFAAELWAEINRKFMKACRLMCIDNRVQKIITCQFWCAHQRFFKNLCIAAKVYHVVRMARKATRMGKAVVIGLQSTGESRTLEHLERHNGRLSNFVSTSKMIIQSFVEKHFPAPKREAFHHLLNTGEFKPETQRRPPRPKKARMSTDWFDDDMDAEAAESDIEMYENTLEEDRIKSGRKRRGRPPKTEKTEKITMQDRILEHLCTNMRAQDNVDDAAYSFDNTKQQKANITEHDVERCIRAREMLLDKIDVLGKLLPPNTLDVLISELGGTGSVAEMTGRRGRVVREEFGGYKYESRCENDTSMDLINYSEKQRFMNGLKNVAIISEAASSGISLQSDKRVSNQRRRLHITLELPWSADRAIQQFGRTHRSNQVNSPEYVFIISDLAGERRFASTVAKRLESLGALTQGDRRATDARDLSQFNIDNSIGRSALENVMQQLTGERPLDHANVPASYRGDFLYDCSMAMAGVGMLSMREENKVKFFTVEKDSNNISKFLNRILGCCVEVQNALFKFFLDKMYSLILQMKRKGHFDLGILDLDAHGACVKSVKLMRFIRKHATGTAATELHTVTVERGMSYDTALAKFSKEGRHDHEGFYVLQQQRHNKNSAIMCLQVKSNAPKKATTTTSSLNKVSLQLYRPNTGPQVRLETLGSILTRYVKVEPETARDFWQQQYDVCLDKCSHIYWNGVCPYPAGCEVGLRVRPYHVLSGLMLPIWDRIEMILEKSGHKIQIIRVKTDVNKKIVGTVVPQGVYDALVADLSSDSIVESH